MKTLLLNPTTWDLTIDSARNISVAANPYAIAQDVASAIRLFIGELWYDTTQGVPYINQILAKAPPVGFLQAQFVKAGLTVPETVSIRCVLDPLTNTRNLTGKLYITDSRSRTVVTGGRLPWWVSAVFGGDSGLPTLLGDEGQILLGDGGDILVAG